MQTIKNKRGLSNLIATVFIILLSMTAITILSTQILSLIRSPALAPEASCPVIISKKLIQVTNACYNQETGEIELTLIKNHNEININSLRFLLDGESYLCGDSCGTCQIIASDLQTYYFDKKANQVTIFIDNCLTETKEINNC